MPENHDLELISFKLCPFVQRTVITLEKKNAPYRIRYVDLADPPDWFLQLSPSKKVPLLRIDGAGHAPVLSHPQACIARLLQRVGQA